MNTESFKQMLGPITYPFEMTFTKDDIHYYFVEQRPGAISYWEKRTFFPRNKQLKTLETSEGLKNCWNEKGQQTLHVSPNGNKTEWIYKEKGENEPDELRKTIFHDPIDKSVIHSDKNGNILLVQRKDGTFIQSEYDTLPDGTTKEIYRETNEGIVFDDRKKTVDDFIKETNIYSHFFLLIAPLSEIQEILKKMK